MVNFSDLQKTDQDYLMKYAHEYHVLTDHASNKQYILYEGKEVSYDSLKNIKFLKG